MKKTTYLFLFILAVLLSCAKRGQPSGGEKDTDAPKLLKAIPENYSTQFLRNEIRLYFDEYVTLKDITKQLVISPPLKYLPTIIPQSGASKFIKIKIKDTLQPNTTYSFNFGNSIVDNNESNPLPYFKYVFSTGNTIDSLQLKGNIKDALYQEIDQFVSVLLYEIDSTYSDSVIYKKLPRYITNTLDSATTFKFENLKAGKYVLIALKEEDVNYKFNQKTDKIAFIKEEIILPTKQEYELKLFKEDTEYRALKPKHERKTRIKFRYEGAYNENINIKLITKKLPKNYQSILLKNIDNDTLNYWFKPGLKLDSLNFAVTHQTQKDTFRLKLRKKINSDSLTIKPSRDAFSFHTNFGLIASTPILKIDDSKIKIINRDSATVKFTSTINKLTGLIEFHFKKEENEKYQIKIYPNAFTDFYNNTNDTLNYSALLPELSKLSNMRVTLKNMPKQAVIVQLLVSGKVKYEQFGKGKAIFDFDKIHPAKYSLRVIFDANSNQKYDTGNYLKKRQPERIIYYPDKIEVRANWDVDQQFILK